MERHDAAFHGVFGGEVGEDGKRGGSKISGDVFEGSEEGRGE